MSTPSNEAVAAGAIPNSPPTAARKNKGLLRNRRNDPRVHDIHALTKPDLRHAWQWFALVATLLGLAIYGWAITWRYQNVEDAARAVDVFAETLKRQPIVFEEDATPEQKQIQEFRFLMQRMRVGDVSKLKDSKPNDDGNPYQLVFKEWKHHYDLKESKPSTLRFLGDLICHKHMCDNALASVEDAVVVDDSSTPTVTAAGDPPTDATQPSDAQETHQSKGAPSFRTELEDLLAEHVARTPCSRAADTTCSAALMDPKTTALSQFRPVDWRLMAFHWRTKDTPTDDALIKRVRTLTGHHVPGDRVGNVDERLQEELLEKFLSTLLGEVRSASAVRQAEYALVLVRGIEQCLILILGLMALGLLINRHVATRMLVRGVRDLDDRYQTALGIAMVPTGDRFEGLIKRYPTPATWLICRIAQFQLRNPEQTLGELRECKVLIEEAFQSHHQMIDWAIDVIPPIGFFGTVVGIMIALSDAGAISAAADAVERTQAITFVAGSLGLAFATTAVALVVSTLLGRYLRHLEIREEYALTELESRLLAKVEITNGQSPAAPPGGTPAPADAPSPDPAPAAAANARPPEAPPTGKHGY